MQMVKPTQLSRPPLIHDTLRKAKGEQVDGAEKRQLEQRPTEDSSVKPQDVGANSDARGEPAAMPSGSNLRPDENKHPFLTPYTAPSTSAPTKQQQKNRKKMKMRMQKKSVQKGHKGGERESRAGGRGST